MENLIASLEKLKSRWKEKWWMFIPVFLITTVLLIAIVVYRFLSPPPNNEDLAFKQGEATREMELEEERAEELKKKAEAYKKKARAKKAMERAMEKASARKQKEIDDADSWDEVDKLSGVPIDAPTVNVRTDKKDTTLH